MFYADSFAPRFSGDVPEEPLMVTTPASPTSDLPLSCPYSPSTDAASHCGLLERGSSPGSPLPPVAGRTERALSESR